MVRVYRPELVCYNLDWKWTRKLVDLGLVRDDREQVRSEHDEDEIISDLDPRVGL